MRGKSASVVAAVMALAAAAGVLGFWFHTSPAGAVVLGKYSPVYFVSLCLWTVLAALVFPLARAVLTDSVLDFPSGRRLVLRPRRKILAAVLCGAALAGAAEAALLLRHGRVLQRRARLVGEFHPYLQVAPAPGDERFGINRWGFRGEEIEKDKADGAYRIFVLGGSTVFCADVDFEHSHPRVLETRLREARPGVRIEVQNAGMQWYTSEHSVVNFLFRVREFDPDLVVVYHGINDLYRGFSPARFARGGYRADYGHYHGPVARMLRTYMNGEAGSLLVRRTRAAFARDWWSDLRGAAPPEPVEIREWKSLGAFERNMDDLVSLVRSEGIEPMLATQPYLYKSSMTEDERAALRFPESFCLEEGRYPDVESMIRGMDAFNAVSRKLSRERSVRLVDLEPLVPKDLDHFVDDVHYTERGNTIVGEAFARAVIDAGLGVRTVAARGADAAPAPPAGPRKSGRAP